MKRMRALLSKELLDLRQNPGVFLPAALTGLGSLLLPFFVAVLVPYFTGERLSDSSDFAVAQEMYRAQPGSRSLDPEGAIQAWVFQTFLVMIVALTPVAGSMSVAAYSVVGEKQSRTLEPLLATPLTTFELLAAKVLGAAIPALLMTIACYGIYLIAIAAFARPGVWMVLFLPRSLAVVFVLGPLASLAALQLAVCVSSRVNDARSAQQIGVLIVLPLAGLLIAQVMGTFFLTVPVILAIAAGLAVINAVLMRIAITVFDRESILTRWR